MHKTVSVDFRSVFSYINWGKGADHREAALGSGIPSFGNRVLALLQVTTGILLQQC
jgi:hypothetical protein